MKGFKNAKVYVDGKGIVNATVGVENGKIVYIGDDESVVTEPYAYSEGQTVFPGFIDEHIHGANGADAMDGSTEAISAVAIAVASEGTTGFLATTMTQSPENVTKALRAVKEYVSDLPETGAEPLGVHLEGPFISLKHVGAQPKEYVVSPDVETFEKYNEASGNNVRIVTLAPENDKDHALVKYLSERKIVASAGHTDSGFDDIFSAFTDGLSNVTHTYNAQKPLHHREVGTVGSAMLIDGLNCEVICDLIHVSAPAIKLLIKNKPHDKVTLITDSMRAKHLPDGVSELGGQTVYVKNGEARLADGTLAGSILKMNDAIRNIVTKCDVPLTDAVDFATKNPAKNIGVFDKVGSITVGKLANFAVLNDDFSVALTVRNGNVIYKK